MCFLLILIFFPFSLYPTALRFDVNCKTWICVSCFETARRRFKIRSRNSILRVCPSVPPSVGHTSVEFLIKDISEVTLNEIVSGPRSIKLQEREQIPGRHLLTELCQTLFSVTFGFAFQQNVLFIRPFFCLFGEKIGDYMIHGGLRKLFFRKSLRKLEKIMIAFIKF